MQHIKKIASATICSVSVIIGIVITEHSDEIRTSKDGLEIIGNAESCRNEPYYCPANVLTDGIGNTHNVNGKKKNDEEIAADWVSNIKQAEQCVNLYANGEKLPQSVFDATTSLVFNVGCTKVKTSTMFRYLNAGDYVKACNELPRWNKSAGKVINGLTKRRRVEFNHCMTYNNPS